MARPTTRGSSLLGPKTVGAFAVGVAIGIGLVAPVLPDAVGEEVAAMMTGSGSVVIVGVGALAALMVLLAVFYQLYL